MDRSQCSKERVIALVHQAAGTTSCAVRVAAASTDGVTRDRLAASFRRGDFATWTYDDARAERAADPASVLEGARSVLCVAVAYATAEPFRPPLAGRVSNYAWSHDYHERMLAMLRDAAARIDAAAGRCVTAVACDTKPIAERAFAARAGLGWIGKHTNLIASALGSFVYLGEIVTTLPLEADAVLAKSCGACARCVDACPTRALRGDYTIDATRCISDLTQRTDAIPRALRPLVGEWVWGCDLCQRVCPPTRRAGAMGSNADAPANARCAAPGLVWLLGLRSGEFRKYVRATGMGWRGAAVLRRNAAVALGNARDRSTVPALLAALSDDPHPMVRSHVAWALGRIAAPGAILGLRARLRCESDDAVREEIEAALCDALEEAA